MEKKYYDIIVELIKENKKFTGLEPILDDIVQDVYEHSKVVVASVSNEDVIVAYLKKVIATSIITVPKKLNFKTKRNHDVLKTIESLTGVSLDLSQNTTEVKEEQIEPFTNDTIEELVIEEDNNDDELNDISSPNETFEVEQIDNNKNEDVELEQNNISDFTDLETIDALETSDDEEDILVDAPDTIEKIEPIEEIGQEVNVNLVDKMINGISTENTEDNYSFLETDENENENENENDLLLEEVEDIEDTLIDFSENTSILSETEESDESLSESEVKLPCYDCFNFEPKEPEYAKDEICNNLLEYNSKYSDKNALEICNLKYKEQMPISKIAETLNLQEEAVIETLNDIIELVKDL